MGRPPLKSDKKTKYVAVRMPEDLFERIEASAGENQVAAFLRSAAEEKLERDENRR